jgi:hypothetical protein
MDDIAVVWLGPREVSVTARRARIQLALRLRSTAATRLLTVAAGMLPGPAWRVPGVAETVAAGAARLVGAAGPALSGRAPAGQPYRVRPRAVWLLSSAPACGLAPGGCGRVRSGSWRVRPR